MARFLAACGGFLLAILWMDLMFDVQAWPPGGNVDAQALHAIAAYYRRVTTEAFPMNRLIGVVMIATVLASVARVVRPRGGRRAPAMAALLACAPIALALLRVFPDAVRLGAAADVPAVQTALAQSILRGHLFCFAAIALFTALQLRPERPLR